MKINRIEEIALDCIVETVNDSPYWVFSPAEFNKFADQIVQECMNVCLTMKLIGPHKEMQAATLEDAAREIKEHFVPTE